MRAFLDGSRWPSPLYRFHPIPGGLTAGKTALGHSLTRPLKAGVDEG